MDVDVHIVLHKRQPRSWMTGDYCSSGLHAPGSIPVVLFPVGTKSPMTRILQGDGEARRATGGKDVHIITHEVRFENVASERAK